MTFFTIQNDIIHCTHVKQDKKLCCDHFRSMVQLELYSLKLKYFKMRKNNYLKVLPKFLK